MKKKEIAWLHLLFWFLVFNLIIVANLPKSETGSPKDFFDHILDTLFSMSTILILFYAAYFTFPYFNRKPIRFIWIAGLYLLGFLLSLVSANRIAQIPVFMKFMFAFFSGTGLISFVVFGFLIRLVIQGIQDGRLKRQLEKEQLTTQLELLKSQINPHFLFNTLNNIDILIKEDPGRASQYLNKLSDILRYSLYETKQDQVPLEDEIENIHKYIELQKIRTQNPSFASLTVEGDLTGLSIAPMIFLPFIENAFKHSTNKKIENAIVIRIQAGRSAILFECKNHCTDVFQPDENSSGMGMNLIRSRFDLLFRDKYSLGTVKSGDWYEVNLKIEMDGH